MQVLLLSNLIWKDLSSAFAKLIGFICENSVRESQGRNGPKPFGPLSGAMGLSVSLAANEVSLPLVRLPALQNERRDNAEETSDVKKVPSERNELRADQPNVTGASDKEIRSAANGERAPEIEKEK